MEKKEMSYNLGQQFKKSARIRHLFVAGLVLGCACGTVTVAAAQNVVPPPTPADITPPAGNTAYLLGHAQGTKGSVCLRAPAVLPGPSTLPVLKRLSL